jgi:hypothetical protein
MLLMLKVATFTKYLFCAIGGIVPALAQNTKDAATHYVSDLAAIKARPPTCQLR